MIVISGIKGFFREHNIFGIFVHFSTFNEVLIYNKFNVQIYIGNRIQ